jgi:membrane protein implicated in regulation of membrane protease activity
MTGLRSMKSIFKSIFRYAIIAIIFVFAIAAVHAEGITAVSPADGATMDPTMQGFAFSTLSGAMVANCKLLIDNETAKTIAYNDQIIGKNIQYLTPVEDGNHTWQVACDTDNGTLSTPVRAFAAKNPADTGVKVTSSGVFRGSFDHEFTFANSPSQRPVVVQKLAPGDFIIIDLKVPPSTISQSLYVKQQASKNGKQFLWLQDQKKWENYYLYLGENTTINISTSRVILSFQGMSNNKATVIAYPAVSKQAQELAEQENKQATEEASQTTGETPNETAQQAESQAPQENQAPESKPTEQPAEKPETTKPAETASEQKPAEQQNTPAAPKQGVFKRILAWFSGIFG